MFEDTMVGQMKARGARRQAAKATDAIEDANTANAKLHSAQVSLAIGWGAYEALKEIVQERYGKLPGHFPEWEKKAIAVIEREAKRMGISPNEPIEKIKSGAKAHRQIIAEAE